MKFTIKNNSRENIASAMRRLGYHFFGKTETGQMNFIHSLDQGFYPRFHLYTKEQGEEIAFNLHLDQKKPRYKGATAHNADYDGPQIQQEADRIKKFFQ